MAFLVRPDFDQRINETDLDLIIDSSDRILNDAITSAQIEIESYLRDRFDVALIFFNIQLFTMSLVLAIGDKILLFAENYVSATNYVVGDLVNNENSGIVYRCIQNTTVSHEPLTNTAFWLPIGKQNQLYNCKLASMGNYPNNTTYFEEIESRNALIVRQMVDLVLYELHSRINPRNIPEHRIQRRDDAIKYLRDVADPRKNITPDLPLITFAENTGVDISFGTTSNENHSY